MEDTHLQIASTTHRQPNNGMVGSVDGICAAILQTCGVQFPGLQVLLLVLRHGWALWAGTTRLSSTLEAQKATHFQNFILPYDKMNREV